MDTVIHCFSTELFALLQDTLLYALQPSGYLDLQHGSNVKNVTKKGREGKKGTSSGLGVLIEFWLTTTPLILALAEGLEGPFMPPVLCNITFTNHFSTLSLWEVYIGNINCWVETEGMLPVRSSYRSWS